MKLPCYLVQDLLPLYKDSVCDPQTARDVREHLSSCTACRELLHTMEQPDADLESAASNERDAANAAALDRVKKDLRTRQKQLAVRVAGVLLALFCVFFGWMHWMMHSYVTPTFTDLQLIHKDSSHDRIAFQSQSTGVYYTSEGYVTKYYDGIPIAFMSVTQTRWEVLMQKLSPRETPIWIPSPETSIAVVNHETYETLCAEDGRIFISADRLVEILATDDSFYIPVTRGNSANFDHIRETVSSLCENVRAARNANSKE